MNLWDIPKFAEELHKVIFTELHNNIEDQSGQIKIYTYDDWTSLFFV